MNTHPDCICKHVRPTSTLGTPHWADLDVYCPVHGTRQAVPHNLERFPAAQTSYACDPCQHGDHVGCQERNVDVYDSWSNTCACLKAALASHIQVKRAAKRDALAKVIYDARDGLSARDFWLSTVDGTPNTASYAIADALIENGLAR